MWTGEDSNKNMYICVYSDEDSMLKWLDILQIYLWHLNCDDGMFMAWLQLCAAPSIYWVVQIDQVFYFKQE